MNSPLALVIIGSHATRTNRNVPQVRTPRIGIEEVSRFTPGVHDGDGRLGNWTLCISVLSLHGRSRMVLRCKRRLRFVGLRRLLENMPRVILLRHLGAAVGQAL